MLRVKQLIHEQWLTVSDVARGTGIDNATVSKIVNGRMKPYKVHAEKIAAFLGYDGELSKLFSEPGCCPYCGAKQAWGERRES